MTTKDDKTEFKDLHPIAKVAVVLLGAAVGLCLIGVLLGGATVLGLIWDGFRSVWWK